MHEHLSHPDLASLDLTRKAAALDRALTPLRAHERSLTALKTSVASRLADVEGRFQTATHTAEDTNTRADLREALGQVERGPRRNEGVLPEVAPFVGLPGLTETRAEVARLSAEYTDAVHLRDHANDVSTYRLKPNAGTHWVADGTGQRRLRPGETVTLTLAQFKAFEDKLEPVEVPEPDGASTGAGQAQVVEPATIE